MLGPARLVKNSGGSYFKQLAVTVNKTLLVFLLTFLLVLPRAKWLLVVDLTNVSALKCVSSKETATAGSSIGCLWA